MCFRTRFVAFSLVASLAGCGTVPLRSLPSLARIDAQTTDLSELRVALRMPDAIKPLPRGVRLQAVIKTSGEADREVVFKLTQTEIRPELIEIPSTMVGTTLYLFHFSNEEADRFNALRASVLMQRHGGKAASIGLGIAATEFCRTSDLPEGPIFVTTYLRTSETRRFVEASRDLDLRSAPDVSTKVETLARCPAA